MTLTSSSLLELYQEQKSGQDDLFNPFPSFRIWKVETIKECEHEMDNTNVDDIMSIEVSDKPVKRSVSKKLIVSNMDKARLIFTRLMLESGGIVPSRKEAMSAFIFELKLSSACASTYSHNIRQKYI